jgi:hypothetical protein
MNVVLTHSVVGRVDAVLPPVTMVRAREGSVRVGKGGTTREMAGGGGMRPRISSRCLAVFFRAWLII